ncbi:DUF3570 domain-containing protein [Lutibacter sp. TH_r2]|uniref:DUF3570 domain-containing protein n=1 Tax=Lutibacter sp. TH_r2 TaxID=3082083 RepID=UPI002954B81E|nr:DUF3570 domain-containing protein [Lutibacter sp. TH_r2]MDV7187004.1 DUF3570 domain-containing protein [Lutibacter sp. TH_r2]
MKKILILFTVLFTFVGFSQTKQEENKTYKKRVLENTEVDFISSYYSQDGDNAAVTGGIGTEELTDIASSLTVSIPLNDDDVLTIDATISAYSSASSSNLDPFDSSGASAGGGDDEDDIDGDDEDDNYNSNGGGSPWVESSGASQSDAWVNLTANYSHSSDDRNTIVGGNVSVSKEYDYTSFGFGGSFTKLFNEKNTEIGVKANVYFDSWQPVFPTELDSYIEAGQNLNNGFFNGIDILNQNGDVIDKNNSAAWSPLNTTLIDDESRNTYSLSLSFSQILSKKAQFSIFADIIQQNGWLANPMQRVYFSDRDNYYVGNASSIPNYTSKENTDVFQLADDIERLPDTRFKIPVGARFNYYLNEVVSLRTYYRYYYDDWGVSSHTASVEVPIKLSDKFTIYPSYRYYNQTAADYFAPYEQLVSTDEFYTSDYDLSEFNSNQYSLGISYTDIFTKRRIWKLGLKSIDLKYSNYERNTGLTSSIFSLGFKFVMD